MDIRTNAIHAEKSALYVDTSLKQTRSKAQTDRHTTLKVTTTAERQVLFSASCVNDVRKQYMSVKLGYHCMKEWWSTFRTFVIENKIRYQNILQRMVIL